MSAMPFRKPALQQQFVPRTATSFADCTATVGAMAADVASQGLVLVNHADVRRNTNEPRPDPASPGLTLQQVADSVRRISGESLLSREPIRDSWDELVGALVAGAWAMVAAWRGVLVDNGYGGSSPFRAGHAYLYGYDQNEMAFVLADPLVPRWMRVAPRIVARGAREYLVRYGAGAQAGDAYYSLTPDVYESAPPEVPESEDVMFNVAPATTHRDVILRPETVLYEDSALTERYSHSGPKRKAFGFWGSGGTFHVIVNGGQANYVRREDVLDVVENDRTHE